MKSTFLGIVSMNLGLWIHIWASLKSDSIERPKISKKSFFLPLWLLLFIGATLFLSSYFNARSQWLEEFSMKQEYLTWFIAVFIITSISIFNSCKNKKSTKAKTYSVTGSVIALLGFSIFLISGYHAELEANERQLVYEQEIRKSIPASK